MLRQILPVLLICLLSCSVKAQFIFQNIRWQDGLSAKEIRCLYKDDDGFLWIGSSNGLNRFDGAVVRQYKNTKGETSIYINAIHPFPGNDSLLLGTREGIRIFNKHTGSFRADKRFAALENEVISCIQPDDRNRLWIGTNKAVFVYDKNKLFTAAEIMPDAKKIAYQGFSVSAFAWDKSRNGFWVGGNKPYFIDCKKNLVYDKANNPYNYPVLNKESVFSLALDNKNNLWFGCNNEMTLNYWDAATNKIDSFAELDGKKLSNGSPNRIFVDKQDRVWISTWLYACFIKEPGKPIKKIPFSQTQTYSIAYGFFRDAIEDTEGNIWLATINGISKSQSKDPLLAIYQLPSFNFFLESGFAQANYVDIDKDMIMACKEEGVIAYNTTERSYKRYVVTTGTDYIRNKFIMSVKSGSTWWFAGSDGVYYLENGSNSLQKFTHIKQNEQIKDANFIFTDYQKNIWFQVVHDALYRYNPVTKKTDRFDGKDEAHGLFSSATSKSFLSLKNNNLLFAMSGSGLVKFDMATEKFSVIPVANAINFNVSKLQEDKQGNIWAATTGRGILKLDTTGKIIDSINTSNGLLYDNISSIIIDNRGLIWAATREGLMFFDPATKAVTKVDIDLSQSLQDYWNNITFVDGKIYALMLDHVVVIDPLRFASVKVKKPPHITAIKVFGEEIVYDDKNDRLDISQNEDYVTFQFASLNHREIPALQYSYQLEGVDKDWINSGRDLSASYNNLSPGDYTFKVRSTDEHGQWMDAITKFSIHVKFPWWRTGFFKVIFLLASLALLFVVYKSYIKRRKKKAIDRTIDYFANSIYGENSVNEICWDIARNCISQLSFEDCVVYLLDEKRNILVQKAAYGPKNPKGHEIINPIEIEIGNGIVGTVAATGRALRIDDTTKDSRYIVDDEKRLSELCVPILHDGKVIGIIDSENKNKSFFTDEHLKAMITIASISSNKIAEAQAEAYAKENEIKLLEINKLLAESQLMALRAQMNPHFVFNCLNSIQECIVTEKYGEASKYLNKFSKLFRFVLNNSGKNLVSIDEEKQVLELYLELEQMRFEQSFTWQIITDDELETDEILIPSMLLQPYVENALWHGLMHKQGERRLLIEFKKIAEDTYRCIIDDNGIGRKKSFELKEQQSKAKRHESKGLKISKDRLNILHKQGFDATLSMIDKEDEDGNAQGTTIIIELSTFLKK